jgi:hypothetical protein
MITKQKAKALVEKLGYEPTRKGKELGYKYKHHGTMILFAAVPKGKGKLNFDDKFRKQLTLDKDQFDAGLACPFKASDFHAHLVRIGKIEEQERD